MINSLHAGAQIRSNVAIPCPDELVRLECIVNSVRSNWRITPLQTQTTLSIAFQKSGSFETRTVSPSGLSATVDLSYISKNDTSMTTVAEFLAVPELQGAQFSCVGQNSVAIYLDLAG